MEACESAYRPLAGQKRVVDEAQMATSDLRNPHEAFNAVENYEQREWDMQGHGDRELTHDDPAPSTESISLAIACRIQWPSWDLEHGDLAHVFAAEGAWNRYDYMTWPESNSILSHEASLPVAINLLHQCENRQRNLNWSWNMGYHSRWEDRAWRLVRYTLIPLLTSLIEEIQTASTARARRPRRRPLASRPLNPRLGLAEYSGDAPAEGGSTCIICARLIGICDIVDQSNDLRYTTTIPICPMLSCYRGKEKILTVPEYRRYRTLYCPDHFQMTGSRVPRQWHYHGELTHDKCPCCTGKCPIKGCNETRVVEADTHDGDGLPPDQPDRDDPGPSADREPEPEQQYQGAYPKSAGGYLSGGYMSWHDKAWKRSERSDPYSRHSSRKVRVSYSHPYVYCDEESEESRMKYALRAVKVLERWIAYRENLIIARSPPSSKSQEFDHRGEINDYMLDGSKSWTNMAIQLISIKL